MQGYYEKNCRYGTSQCDISGKWKLSSILQAVQDAANEHCQLMRVGREDLATKGISWVLFKTELQIDRYPQLGEIVKVQTFTKGSTFKFFPRYYTIEDEYGLQICRAGSLWILMDSQTRHAITSKESGIKIPCVKDIVNPINISTASRKIVGKGSTLTYKPIYTDIDFNSHVNNIRYADWLCNALGLQFLIENEISFVSIAYNYEVPPDIELSNTLILEENKFQFSGRYDVKTYFNIDGIIRKRQR